MAWFYCQGTTETPIIGLSDPFLQYPFDLERSDNLGFSVFIRCFFIGYRQSATLRPGRPEKHNYLEAELSNILETPTPIVR